MNFKKGDLVRVKKWNKLDREFLLDKFGDRYVGGVLFTSGMKRYCGGFARVSEISSRGNYLLIFNGKKNDAHYYFSDAMLKKVDNRKLEKKANKSLRFNEELL